MTERRFGDPVPGWHPPPLPGPAAMAGRFVRLERLDPARHAGDLWAAWAGADAIWDYLPYGPFHDAAACAAHVAALAAKADCAFFALCDPDTGGAGGVAAWLRIDPGAGSIEVGHICLGPALQRTPAATEAMALMMGWAFDAGYRRYEWKCDALNLPSRRAAARLGMAFEGVFRQAAVVKGRNRDTAWFAVIDRDWPALRAALGAWLAPGNFDAAGRQRVALRDLTAALAVAGQGGRPPGA